MFKYVLISGFFTSVLSTPSSGYAVTFNRAYVISVIGANAADSVLKTEVALIQTKFREINANINALKKVSRDIEGESAEGGEITKFYEGNELKKIVEIAYGETGKLTEEFYYNGGKLFFYYALEVGYTMPISIDSKPIYAWKKETRYYILNGKIIKYVCAPAKNITTKKLKEIILDLTKEAKK